MTITIVDIAKRVGVSHTVVSKVLNGGTSTVGASEETCKKVFKVAEEMGYRPHGAGQALRRRYFRSIGVLMGSTHEFYLPQQVMTTLSQVLASNHYTCTLVCIKDFDVDNLISSPFLKSHLVDVLLIGYVYEPPISVVRIIEQMEVPAIWLNRVQEVDAVFVDEDDAACQLVRHLVKCEYRDITYIDYSGAGNGNPVTANRLRGFKTEAQRLGIKTSYMIRRRIPRGQRVEASRKWLSKLHYPKAVITNSFASAQAIMQAAISLGLKIPDDLGIASFDNGTNYTIPEPSITCMIYPEEEFGQAAAEIALKKARNPRRSFKSCRLKYFLAIGGSTIRQHVLN